MCPHREDMAQANVAPSIESLLNLAPEDPESWVLGSNPKVNRIARHVERAADVECTVLVSGETGTGKELWARLLHRLGPRRDKPFVPVNCAALTATLAESQLFGHEKGAFTGAAGRSLGVFRAAEGGIVFLDEVGEMPLELQPKLLRVLQQHEVTPVGSSMPVQVNVQVVAATNRDLEIEVAEGRFREDLYYRLNMVEFHVPPLRHRVDDIPQFVDFFSRKFAARYQRPLWQPNGETLRNSASIAGRATFASWRTSSSRRTCSIASRVCRSGRRLAESADAASALHGPGRTAPCRRAAGPARHPGHKGRAAQLAGRASQHDDPALGPNPPRRGSWRIGPGKN